MKITKDALILAQALGGGGGITPTGNQDITTLDEYDVTDKATARVSAGERAKIIPGNITSGTTILGVAGSAVVPSGTISISSNGSHNVEAFARAEVLVPASAVCSGTTNISSNGTFNVTGYSSASVAVPASAVCSGTISISSNGIVNVTGYANADVNVEAIDSRFQKLVEDKITDIDDSNISIIRKYAFFQMSRLETVRFPNCSIVGYAAFQQCTKLTSADFPACTNINDYSAFSSCASLTTISFPVCKYIGGAAFYSCPKLLIASFPSCTSMGTQVFQNCIRLHTAWFPAVSNFPMMTFQNCYNLLSLYLLGSSVVGLQMSGALSNTPIAGRTTSTGGVYGSIFVPASLYDTYRASTNWVYFSDRFVSLTDAQIAALG